jgi:hypothetical protein
MILCQTAHPLADHAPATNGIIGLSQPQPHNATTSASSSPATAYAFKASLIGAAHQFELRKEGLSWRIGGRSGVWPYADIAAIGLSYRPVSMQSRRFRADIDNIDGGRMRILSTTWQTAALMAPQDNGYRAFITQLHGHMAQAGSKAALIGGLRPHVYAAAVVLLVLVGIAIAGLLVRAVATGEWAGGLFLIGFAALFTWQIGGFVRRNRPRTYTFDHLPQMLLP